MTPRSRLHPAAAALAALVLAGPATAPQAAAETDPQQTQTCNEPPPARGVPGGGDGDILPLVTGKALKPGGTVKTRGTNPDESPELGGFEVFSETRSFSFQTDLGPVAGLYTEKIVQGTDRRCKCHVRVQLQQGCLGQVKVGRFVHKPKLVADWRDDLPGQVPARSASRSFDGQVITFDLKAPVCAGQSTRWLLLNTGIDTMDRADALSLVAPNGQASLPQPFFVPRVGP